MHGRTLVRLTWSDVSDSQSQDVLLLEALEYLAVRCKKVTKYVIFRAASWSAYAWVAHREAFPLSGACTVPKVGIRAHPP